MIRCRLLTEPFFLHDSWWITKPVPILSRKFRDMGKAKSTTRIHCQIRFVYERVRKNPRSTADVEFRRIEPKIRRSSGWNLGPRGTIRVHCQKRPYHVIDHHGTRKQNSSHATYQPGFPANLFLPFFKFFAYALFAQRRRYHFLQGNGPLSYELSDFVQYRL